MATQTLTYATSTSHLTKLTIPNVTTLPRTHSVESIKLIGGNPSPSSSASQPLQRSSSASEMLALVNLANLQVRTRPSIFTPHSLLTPPFSIPFHVPPALADYYSGNDSTSTQLKQRLHIRASEPSSSSGSSYDDDDDLLENPASSSSSSSSSDSEECETPDQISPPYTRPTSPIGFVDVDEPQAEEDWDLRSIKYTAGADLTPCFARGSADALRSSFSDSEDDEADDDEGMVIKKRSWAPGTPAIEKVEYHWNATPSTSSASTPFTASEEESGYFDDGDDDDMVGSEADADEVWPDEMDSDDFPYLHSWPHSWIWTPPASTQNPTPAALPQIHFHYVESQMSDQSSWTPLQDAKFGGALTVPGHRVYNCPPTPPTTRGRRPAGMTTTLVPVQQMCEGAKVEYDDRLGRCAVKVPSLKEQKEMGLYSTLSLTVLASSTSSSASKRGRTRARSRVRGMPEEEDEEEDAEDGGRGRSAARRSGMMGGRQFVLSAIRDADEEEEEEEPFVYDGVSGRARAGRWD